MATNVQPEHSESVKRIISDYSPREKSEQSPVNITIVPNENFEYFHHSLTRLLSNEFEVVRNKVEELLQTEVIPLVSR